MSDQRKIYVVGYPRSGNVWLSRCIAEGLNCGITGGGEGRVSIAEKKSNNKDFIVIQEHFSANEYLTEFTSGLQMNPKEKRDKDAIIFMARHPFDVVVSVYKYWGFNTIQNTIDAMTGKTKEKNLKNYSIFMEQWINQINNVDVLMYFELMKASFIQTMEALFKDLSLVPENDVLDIYNKNTISKTREMINKMPGAYSYNAKIQNDHLRKGIIGDWANYFSESDLDVAFERFGEIIVYLGYFDKSCKSTDQLKEHYMRQLRRRMENE